MRRPVDDGVDVAPIAGRCRERPRRAQRDSERTRQEKSEGTQSTQKKSGQYPSYDSSHCQHSSSRPVVEIDVSKMNTERLRMIQLCALTLTCRNVNSEHGISLLQFRAALLRDVSMLSQVLDRVSPPPSTVSLGIRTDDDHILASHIEFRTRWG
jgi:hypothetical protein